MTTSNILEIGKRIRVLRENLGLTQLDLAKKLNVKRQTVAQWENGERDLKTGYIISLAKFFNVTADYLLGLSEYKTSMNTNIGEQIGLSDRNIESLKAFNKIPNTYKGATFTYTDIINELIDKILRNFVVQELFFIRLFSDGIDEINTDCMSNDTERLTFSLYSRLNTVKAFENIMNILNDIIKDISNYETITENYNSFVEDWLTEQNNVHLMTYKLLNVIHDVALSGDFELVKNIENILDTDTK